MDSTMSSQMDPAATAAFAAFGLAFAVFYLAVMVLMVVSYWKLYAKAGKPGWAAIVPIYNLIVLCELVGKPTWFWLLLFVPFVNLYAIIVLIHGFALSFGKDTAWTVGLLLLGIVFFPLLAFSAAKYVGPAFARSSVQSIS